TAQQGCGGLRSLDLGNMATESDRYLRGAGQPFAHMAAERMRHEPIVAAPYEQRRGPELGQPRGEAVGSKRCLEIDVARRGQKSVARAGGVVDAAELVDDQIAD